MPGTPSAPRTLTQMLREWDDDALGNLLRARPDVAFPTPESFSQVASRATTRHSVGSALDDLDAFALDVAARLAGADRTVDVAAFGERLAGPEITAELVRTVVGRLLGLGLLWGTPDHVRPVRALTGLLEPPADDVPSAATHPPTATGSTASPALADKVGAGSAFEFVRRIEVLVEHCDHHAPRLTRTGTLSQRDIRQLATLLDLTPTTTRQHLDITRAAGMLGPALHNLDEVLLPTGRFDAWQGQGLDSQWSALIEAWWDGHPDSGSPALKTLLVGAFGNPADGGVVEAAGLRPWLAWQRPRRPHGTDRKALTFLDLAGWTGLSGLGALTSYAVGPDGRQDTARLDALLPARVDHVLVQADLTAVAPGPLTPETSRDMNALADVESRGGATVYRISTESLLRARRLGWTSDDTLEALSRHSRTPLPQALEYLIRDLDRQEPPGLERAEDPIDLTVGRHRLADRAVVVAPAADLGPSERLDEEHVAACLAALRADDPHHPTPAPSPDPGRIGSPVDDLREAVESGDVVWFGYVDQRGATFERWVRALSVDDGVLVAEDTSSGERLTVAVHRITSAHIMRSPTTRDSRNRTA